MISPACRARSNSTALSSRVFDVLLNATVLGFALLSARGPVVKTFEADPSRLTSQLGHWSFVSLFPFEVNSEILDLGAKIFFRFTEFLLETPE
jgi:hypothetical protein